ncbi:MAG: lactonase family protein, partial [Chloroflexi bacterium]|nr:lactonase family protein [Chloroflexota bacterium]
MRTYQKAFGIVLLALLPATLTAQNFVYTNDDNPTVNGNTVTAFAVDANGALSQLSCSPIATGGTGGGGGFFASSRIVTAGDYLYAANGGSNSVSGFTVNQTTGCLTPVSSTPFATGGTGGSNGISLAATPDAKYLYAGNAGSENITVFSIGSGGTLAPVGSLVSVAGEPAGMKVSPDGKYLVIALPLGSSGSVNKIAVFSIGSGGALTPVTGSPFTSLGPDAADVDINCSSTQLFVGNATLGASEVDVFNFPPSGGSMTEIEGSPFAGASSPSSQNSNVVTLSPDGSELFVSNQASNSLTVFTVGAGGALTLVPGSPFTGGVGGIPGGLATDQAGCHRWCRR